MRKVVLWSLLSLLGVVSCEDDDGNNVGEAGNAGNAGDGGEAGNASNVAGGGGDPSASGAAAGGASPNGGYGATGGAEVGGGSGGEGGGPDSAAGQAGSGGVSGQSGGAGAYQGGGEDAGGNAGEGGGAAQELAWPLTAAALSAECSPQCASGTCQEQCAAGTYPCDDGCCDSTITTGETPLTDNNFNETSLWVDASDRVTLAYTSTFPFLATSSDQTWSSDSITTTDLPIVDELERIANLNLVRDANGTAFVTYTFRSDQTVGPHWLVSGPMSGPYEPEELPGEPLGLAVGDSGKIAVLVGRQILERTGANTFDAIALPASAPPPRAFTYAAGHYFVATDSGTEIQVWFRAPSGQWGHEAIPVSGAQGLEVQVRHGRVYVGYRSGDDAYLAVRAGSGWDVWAVPVEDAVLQSTFTIDDCGSPHLLVWQTVPGGFWDDGYVRWTKSGWRSFRYATNCVFGDGVSIALTSTHAILASASCSATVVTVPRSP